MAVINFARREIITKIVYFGAANAGCRTMVRTLFVSHTGRVAGGLLPLGKPKGTISQFFQYTPEEVVVPGFSLRVRVYSLPGDIQDAAHRAEVLNDIDAVVFIADAQPTSHQANIDAMLLLDNLLQELDMELSTLPLVFQVNSKLELETRRAQDVAYELNPYGRPVMVCDAEEPVGVTRGQQVVLEEVVRRIQDNLAGHPTQLHVHAIHRREGLTADQVVAAHEQAIQLAHAEETERKGLERRSVPWSRSGYDILPTGVSLHAPYPTGEVAGMRPVHVLETRLDGDQVHVDVVMDDQEGGHPTRVRMVLSPLNNLGTPVTTGGTIPVAPDRATSSATASLPDRIEIVTTPTDMTLAVWYGVGGAAAGLLAGLLAGFLFWA